MGSPVGLYSNEKLVESRPDIRECVASTGLEFNEGSSVSSRLSISWYSNVEGKGQLVSIESEFIRY